jgi:phosphoribosylformimino-5-aminoimidazole carboxamide ribotide isomerase
VIVVPAIDIRGGKVVRLRQGELQAITIYSSDPAEVARRWEAQGAGRLHLVDLDAAISGAPQFEALAAVIEAVRIPVEVGGGLRSLAIAERYRERGADRVIFGSAAVAAPALVKLAVQEWPQAVAVALDARDGKVTVAGWTEITEVAALDLAAEVRSWGVPRLQYTDVVRDGTLVGPNLPAIEEMARASGLRITAAGGVSRIEDLIRLKALEAVGVDEVIVGKALYEGRFTLAQALEVV